MEQVGVCNDAALLDGHVSEFLETTGFVLLCQSVDLGQPIPVTLRKVDWQNVSPRRRVPKGYGRRGDILC